MADNNLVVAGFDDDAEDAQDASKNILQITLEKCMGLDVSLNVHLAGRLDASNCVMFAKRMQKAFAAGFDFLTLDLGAVTFVSSAGVGAMASLLKTARERGGNLVLAMVPPSVTELLEMLDMAKIFTTTEKPDADAARSAMRNLPPYVPHNVSLFPLVVRCPACKKALRVPKAGRYRCSSCRAVLKVEGAGAVSLG